MKSRYSLLLFSSFLSSKFAVSQDSSRWYSLSNINGSVESIMHYYRDDKKTGTNVPYKKFASNTYFNLNYSYRFLDAGIQVESYNPRLQGYSVQYDSITKLVHRFIRLKNNWGEITGGHFYDQFGAGYLFRAYEERQLGIDNVINGVHGKFIRVKNLIAKGFYGEQRNFMGYSPAKIWGADAEYAFSNLGKKKDFSAAIGIGHVSKKQEVLVPLPDFPGGVNATGIRIKTSKKNYSIHAEYIRKSIEPDFINSYIYKKGNALVLNQSYQSTKNWGINATIRRLENMDFKSDYFSTEAVASLNYLPALTRQHNYLVALVYPYNTQALSEAGGQLDYYYHFKKKSKIGGKYGAKLLLNVSFHNNLDTSRVNSREGFTSKYFALGKTKLFRDINTSFEKRFNKLFKATFTYIHMYYNKSVILGGVYDNVTANITVADLLFNITDAHSIRTELQHLFAKQDEKNWAAFLVEYSNSNGFSAYLSDLTDYQNKKIHYINTGLSYSKKGIRLSAGYSRQRAGLICTGGLCRYMPSFTGLNASVNYNF